MNQPPSRKNPDQEQRLNAILAEYLKRKDAGHEVNKVAMLKAYPDLADDLQSWFEGEALVNAGAPAFAATKLEPIPVPSESRETLRPGAVQSDTASEFTSRKFGRYQLLRPLGEGAMGSVYLALDTTLDRQVALKVPKTEGTANAEFMARFTREAKAAAALKHANICSVYDAGEHEGTAYITMDFIDGVPLSRFIGSPKLQSVDSILQMITIIAEAVGHAHSKGVIHRDLKPGNILVDAQLKPHVTDFGLARRVGGSGDESRITQEGLLIGTPAYMAPEQVKGEQAKVGSQSDIYSLGVILFELLTCRLPFDGKVAEMLAKVLRDNPPVPSRIRKDLSEDIDDICLKMLKKEPGQRYSSMAEVIAAIAKLTNKTKATAAVAAGDTARSQSPFEIQKAHVELMLKKGQYAAAIQDLEKLAAEKSPGAKAVGEWARAKLPIARAESKALSASGLAALLETAQQLFAKSDYVGCIQLLDDVPSLRRTEAMEDLLAKARKRETDAEQLLSDIKDMERRQQIDGLEPLVKRFLKLKPNNTYAKRLWEALQTYSKTPASRRTYRYEKGRLQAMPETNFLKQWTVLGLLVGLLVFLSVYAYVIIYLKSGNQTLAVHVDDEWLKSQGGELTLVVDGDDHTITTPSSGGEPLTVTVTLGSHRFSVKHGDTVVHDPKTFEIEKDGRKILQITATDLNLLNSVPIARAVAKGSAGTSGRPSAPPGGAAAAAVRSEPGMWVSLFDGSDVSHWSTLGPFQVREGLLVATDGRSNAISRDEYSDFELEAEWRLGSLANGGIYYREAPTNAVSAGNEYQMIDPAASEIKAGSQTTGALYGVLPPATNAERPVGEWNSSRIVCRGSMTEHWLNGEKILEYDTTTPEWKEQLSRSRAGTGKDNIGTARRGYILLQSQKGELAFRSIRIRGLTASGQMTGSASPTGDSANPQTSDLDRVATGTWIRLVDSSTFLPVPEKMTFNNGVLELETSFVFSTLKFRDVIVRAEVKKVSGQNVGITIRHSPGKEWTQAYAAWFNGTQSDGGDLFGIAKAMRTSVGLAAGNSGHSFEPDQFVDMAVSAIGDQINLYVEGKRVLSATDADYGAGAIALGVFRNGKGQFRNVRYQTFDPAEPRASVDSNLTTPAGSVQPAIAPFNADQAKKFQETWADYLKVPVEYTNSIGMKFRLIPPGEFVMGSTPEQIEAAKPHLYTEVDPERPRRADSEGPQRTVRLTKPFYLSVTEVTQKNFKLVVGSNPSAPPRANGGNNKTDRSEMPVEYVSWMDTGEFCNRLSSHEQIDSAYVITPTLISQTGTGGYRLPTEAEWEYACRAGTTTLFWSGDEEESLSKVAWFGWNNDEGNAPKKVATLPANPFGLFDMHGNVWEWVHDGWQANRSQQLEGGVAVDPRSDLAEEDRRVIRGGDYFMSGAECRSSCRDGYAAGSVWGDVGFRVALSVDAVRQLQAAPGKGAAQ